MSYKATKQYILNKLEHELDPSLYYHGLHHTLDVLATVKELCILENVSSKDQELLCVAALFHDAGFTVSNQEHERLGCEIATSTLPEYGYSERQIEQICGMIMATKIPQNPQNHLEKIICDADLDYLGRSDFYTIGQTLYEELYELGILKSEEQWNRIQVTFLEAHSYWTATNIKRRAPQKAVYLTELKDLVATYEE